MKGTIGLRAKSDRAMAVVLGGSARSPTALARSELQISDPGPETCQPYHAVMELPWYDAIKKVEKTMATIESLAFGALYGLLRQLETADMVVSAVGIVGSPDRDLTKIPGAHIRAHAAEGVLFRAVLEHAADRLHIKRRSMKEKELAALARKQLVASPKQIAQTMAQFGRALGSPWRADQKTAATAAWLCLP